MVDYLERIRTEVKQRLSEPAHDFYHSERVYNLGVRIATVEKADIIVVGASAYLHDLLRYSDKDKGLNYHVSKEAVQEIRKVLKGVDFPLVKLPQVLYAIELHEDYSSDAASSRNTLEGKVLQDADRLDAIGAIGIARCFTFSGHYSSPLWVPEISLETSVYNPTRLNTSAIHHFYEKLLKLKDAMHTSAGRRIAEERHHFMEKFLTQFFAEWKGEK
ncbi:MAG: HD domain-containing protein [Candidatus Woesearchaeota archaeon]